MDDPPSSLPNTLVTRCLDPPAKVFGGFWKSSHTNIYIVYKTYIYIHLCIYIQRIYIYIYYLYIYIYVPIKAFPKPKDSTGFFPSARKAMKSWTN